MNFPSWSWQRHNLCDNNCSSRNNSTNNSLLTSHFSSFLEISIKCKASMMIYSLMPFFFEKSHFNLFSNQSSIYILYILFYIVFRIEINMFYRRIYIFFIFIFVKNVSDKAWLCVLFTKYNNIFISSISTSWLLWIQMKQSLIDDQPLLPPLHFGMKGQQNEHWKRDLD